LEFYSVDSISDIRVLQIESVSKDRAFDIYCIDNIVIKESDFEEFE
jgi:hypothetical protein